MGIMGLGQHSEVDEKPAVLWLTHLSFIGTGQACCPLETFILSASCDPHGHTDLPSSLQMMP